MYFSYVLLFDKSIDIVLHQIKVLRNYFTIERLYIFKSIIDT